MSGTPPVFDALPDPAVTVDDRGRIRRWNEAFADAVGEAGDDTVGEAGDDADPRFGSASITDVFEGSDPLICGDTSDIPERLPVTLSRADGEGVPYELTWTQRADPDERFVVQARERCERPLREALADDPDALLDQLFEHVPASVYVKDRQGRHLRMSEYDIDPVEVIGKTDLEAYPEGLARESYTDDMHVIETGEPILDKEEYNPGTDRWTVTSKVPWRDRDGAVIGLIGVTRLITEKKEYEQALKAQNERLDRFASIVSHDLRNPVQTASGYVDLLAEDCDSEHIPPLQRSIDRMGSLIDDLLSLAQQGKAIDERKPVDLSGVAHESWETIEAGSAAIEIDIDRSVEADEGRLKQAFENLFRNAVEHGGAGVSVHVGTLSDGFYVEDDGPGIPPNECDRVFEHGYTNSDSGNGYGLAIVEAVIEAHGWEVAASESPAGGVRFEITGVEQSS